LEKEPVPLLIPQKAKTETQQGETLLMLKTNTVVKIWVLGYP
jgi:hypothetical protein